MATQLRFMLFPFFVIPTFWGKALWVSLLQITTKNFFHHTHFLIQLCFCFIPSSWPRDNKGLQVEIFCFFLTVLYNIIMGIVHSTIIIVFTYYRVHLYPGLDSCYCSHKYLICCCNIRHCSGETMKHTNIRISK